LSIIFVVILVLSEKNYFILNYHLFTEFIITHQKSY